MHSAAERRGLLAGSAALAATLVVAPPLAGLLWLSGTVPLPLAFGAMMLFVFVVMLAGFLLLRAAHADDMPAPAAWVLGIFATAIAVYALVASFQLLAATAFAIWSILVVGFGIFFRERASGARRMQGNGLLGLLLCAAATVMWCREIAEVPQILARENLLPAWIDYFIHGGVVSHFGDSRAGRQSVDLADFPARFYHYASYMLPAAFAAPLDLPGLPLATSVWLPLGFLTMCAGAYALGAALAGSAGGVAAVAVLTVVPDASNYGLRNGFFSYHWNLLATPGASYAIGVCLLSIALLERWMTARTLRPLAASACLTGGLILLRVHVFAVWFPAWLASAALSTRFLQRRKLAFFGIAVTAFALFVFGFYSATDLAPALELFLHGVHDLQEPTAYTGWYQHVLNGYGSSIAYPVGILLVYSAFLGAFAILYPVSVFVAWRSRGLQEIDFVPISLIICYVLLMFTAPISQHSDPTEFTHRPFVLLYAVVAIATVAALVNWLAVLGNHGTRRLWYMVLVSTGVALLLVWPRTGVLSQHKFQWGWPYYAHKVHSGLPQAAVFMRRNSSPGDLFAVQGLKLDWAANDVATELCSLTGIPAYLARPSIHLLGGHREHVARERYAALAGVAREEDASAALARLRELGIQWYVVADSRGPRWDTERRGAAFVEGMVAVYSTRMTRP